MSKKHNQTCSRRSNLPSNSREEGIEELYKESGENWEQSSDFLKFVFESDELPSRKFMRRRNDG